MAGCMLVIRSAVLLSCFIIFQSFQSFAFTVDHSSSISKQTPVKSREKRLDLRWRRRSLWNYRSLCRLDAKSKTQGASQGERSENILSEDIYFELHSSIGSIPAEAWDSCLEQDEAASPFLEHAWLRCLEESKCASAETGWVPSHVSILIDGEVNGFVPLYIKGHSMGEFIFDSGWADAAHANGIDYYPKLLVGVPFTPATGQRILLHPTLREKYSRLEIARLRKLLGSFLKQVARANKISSVHINFLTEEEVNDIVGELKVAAAPAIDGIIPNQVQAMLKRFKYVDKDEYLRRTSLQYHWTNANSKNDGKPYKSFDDYLSCFKSKRRITIRRERNKVMHDEDIRIDAVVGKDILKYDGLVERMFDIYLSTVDKVIWGRQYLTLEFFQLLVKSDFVDNLCFMCARRQVTGETLLAGDVFAGTFNIVKNGVFYGRYWGCLSEVKNLHFEACYWSSIEYCIKNGLKRMEPGAGGADYKWARGFDAALIHSAHYICHPGLRRAVSQFLDFETENNVELTEYLMQKSVVGSRTFK
jgi:predicted N-acyltransferase